MHTGKAKSSELVIFPDGTLYHIDLKRSDNIPPNILLMGAASRVDAVAKQFDSITFTHRNKARPEFYIVVGTYKHAPVAAFSIGIGHGNVDIVLNELHALFEYNHKKDSWADTPASVRLIRVGTCGTSLPEIPVGTIAISEYSLGLDNLGLYYPAPQTHPTAQKIEQAFSQTKIGKVISSTYCSAASVTITNTLKRLGQSLADKNIPAISGITTSSPGFFAPEGRRIGRIGTAFSLTEFVADIQKFEIEGLKIINHEMETSILFRIAHEILGYQVGAICLVLDNLTTDDFMNAKEAEKRMDDCITLALDALVAKL